MATFIRYNSTSKLWERDTSAATDGSGPWINLEAIWDGIEFNNGQGAGTPYIAYVSGSNVMRFNIATGKSYAFRINNVDKFTIDASGNAVIIGSLTIGGTYIKPSSNSVTAIQVVDSGITGSLLTFDTSNFRVGVKSNAPITEFEVVGGFRVTSTATITTPASGKGIEFGYSSGSDVGYIACYDRSGSVYKKFQIDANQLEINLNSLARTVYGGLIKMAGYTVATLPASPSRGDIAYVTDANAPTFLGVIAGGGAVYCPVFYDNTNWVAF